MKTDKVLVTGSSGHLGEALVRVLRARRPDGRGGGQGGRGGESTVAGLDLKPGPYTDITADITDRSAVRQALAASGATAVIHAATLHKPHVGSHGKQAFIGTNVTGTLSLLEESVAAGARAFVYASTTSAFGRALVPAAGEPAAWITEDVPGIPRNIYGATKAAAEDLCQLAQAEHGLPVIVLRTSRFFPEDDDDDAARALYGGANLKANEFLHRRVDIADVAEAHLLALARAGQIGFGKYVISATTPFARGDMTAAREDTAAAVLAKFPEAASEYRRRGWRLPARIDRVYVNARARAELGWRPGYDFRAVLDALARDEDPRSPLARAVGAKGYHDRSTGVYTA
jgi:nucleoside-diphosphate-sugar epimerase